MGKYRNWTNDDITIAVRSSISVAEVLRTLNLQPSGGNYETVYAKVKELCLDTSHWLGQRHRKGKLYPSSKATPPDELLVSNGNRTNRKRVKQILLSEGVPYVCEICQLSNWMDLPISLHLDHKNGMRYDNRRENLRFLCPNCHSQTPTFSGKNKGNALYLP